MRSILLTNIFCFNLGHRVNKQQDMGGNVYPLGVDEENTYLGVISQIPAYAIFGGRFVPGMYQNLSSPMFEVALDRDESGKIINQFHATMQQRGHEEKYSGFDATISKSHIRHSIFSPHIINEIDSATL